MRLLFPVAILLAAAPLSAKPALQSPNCPAPASQWVRDGRGWQARPMPPKKLTDLPAAEAYASVYRLDERGCMVPVKYRDTRR